MVSLLEVGVVGDTGVTTFCTKIISPRHLKPKSKCDIRDDFMRKYILPRLIYKKVPKI